MIIINVIARTLFFYFFIIFVYRLMGKREIGQLGVIDLIVSILIAELVAISIENLDKTLLETVIPITILVILEIILAYLSIKSKKIRTFFAGKPSLVINKGKINYHEMIKQRYSLDDLLLELRQQQIKSINDVEYAVLEANGSLSIFPYKIFKIKSSYPLPIILDTVIQEESLLSIKKTESWLMGRLKEMNIDIKDVFYAFYRHNKINLILKKDLY